MRRVTRLSRELARVESELTEVRAALTISRSLAETDPLTGLANRRGIELAVNRMIADVGWCALLLIDLDRFKTINDTFGHAVGDAVLTEVANRLRAAGTPSGTAARHGGDEFSVALGPTVSTDADATREAVRVAEAITGPVALPNGAMWIVRASVGAAVSRYREVLWQTADERMYQAKAASRPGSAREGVAA